MYFKKFTARFIYMKSIKCKINKGTQGTQGSIFPKKNNFRRSTVHVGENGKYVPGGGVYTICPLPANENPV